MVQKTVLKVDLSCLKCKKKVLKAVSTLEGVDKIEVDGAKGTLSVTGNADPYKIIISARKVGKHADVVSIGPPPKPAEPQKKVVVEEKKNSSDENKNKNKNKGNETEILIHNPHTCLQCETLVLVPMDRWNEPYPSCSIM
ncbi:heavy metal-associated isoprenylated plant protein 43-like [Cannabis sativa]|uniref:heavy metal-associated isoprenylated plant protein 43-like n=1 Tax=Cannabis sativa TaxID=3483 RepID=UPI0011DFD71C|nr:heavy metal-associated isoprenylated plant protein 43-like [Cannabis sativa]